MVNITITLDSAVAYAETWIYRAVNEELSSYAPVFALLGHVGLALLIGLLYRLCCLSVRDRNTKNRMSCRSFVIIMMRLEKELRSTTIIAAGSLTVILIAMPEPLHMTLLIVAVVIFALTSFLLHAHALFRMQYKKANKMQDRVDHKVRDDAIRLEQEDVALCFVLNSCTSAQPRSLHPLPIVLLPLVPRMPLPFCGIYCILHRSPRGPLLLQPLSQLSTRAPLADWAFGYARVLRTLLVAAIVAVLFLAVFLSTAPSRVKVATESLTLLLLIMRETGQFMTEGFRKADWNYKHYSRAMLRRAMAESEAQTKENARSERRARTRASKKAARTSGRARARTAPRVYASAATARSYRRVQPIAYHSHLPQSLAPFASPLRLRAPSLSERAAQDRPEPDLLRALLSQIDLAADSARGGAARIDQAGVGGPPLRGQAHERRVRSNQTAGRPQDCRGSPGGQGGPTLSARGPAYRAHPKAD